MVDPECNMLVLLEFNKPENRHKSLAHHKIIKVGQKLSWTAMHAIINPVIAVGCDTELAEPSENIPPARVDGNGSEQRIIGVGKVTVAGV
jgi:hypothetical protein